MKRGLFTIEVNQRLAPGTFRMILSGDTSAVTAPGQFVNIALEGKFLRRPISVCDWAQGSLTIIYKVVGKGTEQMSKLPVGAQLDLLTGLGNGYNLDTSGDKPLLIGGGAGIPPMFALAKQLLAQGKKPSVILGFNQAEELFLEEEFKALGLPVTVTTLDGSLGVKGFVTDAMPEDGYTHLYTCGPEPMLKAIMKNPLPPASSALRSEWAAASAPAWAAPARLNTATSASDGRDLCWKRRRSYGKDSRRPQRRFSG